VAFGIKSLGTMTLGITSLGTMTLGITTLDIQTLSITIKNGTLSKDETMLNDTQHNN
jgi:hypothetical protein